MSVGQSIDTERVFFPIDYKVQKRTASVDISISGVTSALYVRSSSGSSAVHHTFSVAEAYDCNANCDIYRTGGGLVAGDAAQVRVSGQNTGIQIEAEL